MMLGAIDRVGEMLRGAGWAVGIFTWCAAWREMLSEKCRAEKSDAWGNRSSGEDAPRGRLGSRHIYLVCSVAGEELCQLSLSKK